MVKISKLTFILIILVLLGPIFDMLTGYYQGVFHLQGSYDSEAISPGVIYRGVFLIPVFFILAHQVKSSARLIIYYFGLVFVAGLLFRELDGQDVEFVRDAQRFLKLMLPIIGFAGLMFIGRNYTRYKLTYHYWLIATLYGGITAFGLLTTDLFGLKLRVYRDVSIGSAGLIDSQNSAGLILLISLPIALYYVYKFQKNRIFLVLLVEGLWLLCAFQLSTRAALVGIPATIVIYHAFLFLKGRYTQNTFQTFSWVVLVILTAVVGFFIVRSWASQDIEYIIEKFGLLAEGHFRNRVPYGIDRISFFSTVGHLFGSGDGGFPTVENDVVDVYGKFGLLTLLPILFFLFYFYLRLFITFLRYKQVSTFALLISFSFYIIHGASAGHALLSSPVNNLFLLVYFLSFLEIKQFETAAVPEQETSLETAGIKRPKSPLAYDT